MSNSFQPKKPDPDHFTRRIDELRSLLAHSDPYLLADRIGATYETLEKNLGQFHLRLWEKQILVSYPDLIAYQEPEWRETP